MNTKPLRRNYGISASVITILVILAILFIALNSFFVFKTNYGASFYSYWLSGRILFAQGGNPYGSDLFLQVKEQFPADPNISGFTLPLYSVLYFLVFTFIDHFEIALVIWMTILEASLIGIAMKLKWALQISGRTLSVYSLSMLLLFSYFSLMAVIDGDIGIIAVLLLLVALDAIRDHDDEFAGIMLAFATIKYSLTFLPILWICIWCLSNHRSTVVIWLTLVVGLLVLVSALFMVNWITEFLRSIVYYYKYLNPIYFSKLIENWQPELGGRIGWAISGFFILIMIIEWIVNAKGSVRAFEWVLALTMTVGFLSGIPSFGKNLYALWIPLSYAADKIVLRWEKNGKWISSMFFLLFLFFPWIIKILVYPNWNNPVDNLGILFPVITIILLYWNRWWNIDTFIENL